MLSKKMLFNCFIAILLVGFFFIAVNTSLASEKCTNAVAGAKYGIWEGFENCRDCGNCDINDFVRLGVAVATWILGIVGSLSLLFFIYGGFMFLVSGGSSERVTKGKGIILGATLGLVIVFTSYMIIAFVSTALGVNTDSILKTGWLR